MVELRNNLSRDVTMQFDAEEDNIVIPAGEGVRIHVGLLAEPRITIEPCEHRCRLSVHWGKNPVQIDRLPKAR